MLFGFRKKEPPKLLPGNQGLGFKGEIAFSNAARTWSEHYDLVDILAAILREHGHRIQAEKSWLVLPDMEFTLLPQMTYFQPLEKGGVRTATTIQVHHPALLPHGVFEYQHSTGDDLDDSFRQGFKQWAEMDLVAFVESLQPKPATCATLKINIPEEDGQPGFARRAILGPSLHCVQRPEVYAKQMAPKDAADSRPQASESHAFCPCCLLTRSFEAFKELIEDRCFYGLRLYAARDGEGQPQADCRVNGVDWEKGAEALRNYVTSWPDAGFEYRKQYVILHTIEKEP